ncbi:hypothetical protein V6N11_028077 [Hibiscus sabdariffa]|uniref:Terpene synthase metal-binding domain-containing protein n=1 Tax=Hibiscus sabdariffa TaxID=183260 RepID=A0ABR2NZY6_9ROSI
MASKFPYMRHRLVEAYLTAVGYYFEPRYALARHLYTKLLMVWVLMDDTYDAYGTFEELQCLTDAMKRFDISAMDKLPADYLKLVYKTVLDVHDDVEEMFTKLAEAFLEQARWVHEGYQPTFDEYIKTAVISAGGNSTMAYVLMVMEEADEKAYQCLINTDNIIYKAINLMCRIYNDIATNEREEKRGAVTGTICYMKQYDVTREEATEAFKDIIEAAFKDLKQARVDAARFIVNVSLMGEAKGCEGILCSNDRIIRALFFGPLHVSGRDYAELVTMKIAVDIFIEAGWVGVMELVLESNSRVVLNWIENPIARPRVWWETFLELDRAARLIGKLSFCHVERADNSMAALLAKEGFCFVEKEMDSEMLKIDFFFNSGVFAGYGETCFSFS